LTQARPIDFVSESLSTAPLKLKLVPSPESLTLSGYVYRDEKRSQDKVSVFVDSGASDEFIDKSFVHRVPGFKIHRLPVPRDVEMFDGTSTTNNQVTHYAVGAVQIGPRIFPDAFYITNLGSHDICFSHSWLKRYNPNINWETQEIHEYRGTQPIMSEENHDPIPLSPSTNPADAFSAGGVIPAIEAEQARRAQIFSNTFVTLQAYQAVSAAIKEKQYHKLTLRSATTLNGVSKNDKDWRESIPEAYRPFADSVFSDESAERIPEHRPDFDCGIDIKEGETLSTCKIYDMSTEELQDMRAFLDEQLRKGFIKTSKSTASSPVFFVNNGKTRRLVIDYRSLNSKIRLDEYPIPLSKTVMERLPTARIFTKFDVRAGFYNLRIKEGDEWKTAFKTMFGLYEFQVMPMGLATAPSTFQRFINSVLAPYLDIFCFAYLDDIIIFSDDETRHQEHVGKVLEALKNASLHLKPSKCEWHKQEITFLGFTAVAGKGIRMSDDKVQALREWKRPENVKEVRMFLGTVNFYHDFIPHYSDLTSPLTELTKKATIFKWTDECQKAWDRLLNCLRTDIFLAARQFGVRTILETDASDKAYAGVIHQPDALGRLRPIMMYSHKFKDEETRWTVAEKELFAIVYAFKKYHYMLNNGVPVEVFTDHRNLARFLHTSKLTGRLGRWYDELRTTGIDFQIQYRAGEENTVADALSRYGFQDDGDDPAFKPLLERCRFSDKCLNDVDQWYLATSLKLKKMTQSPATKFGFDPLAYGQKQKKSDLSTRLEPEHVWDTSSSRHGPDRRGLGFE